MKNLQGVTIFYTIMILSYEVRTLRSLVVSGIRHASVSIFDIDTTPVLRSMFWTLQVSRYPCPCCVRYPCFIDSKTIDIHGVELQS